MYIPLDFFCAHQKSLYKEDNVNSRCKWIKLCPSQEYVEVLTPSTGECDLIWKHILYRCNQIKMRSLGRALFQYDWCPNKKRKMPSEDRDAQAECHVKTEAFTGVTWLWAEECQGLMAAGRSEREARKDSTHSHRPWPCWHLLFRLLNSGTVREQIYFVFSYPVCGN